MHTDSMEEKETAWGNHSIRSIFGLRHIFSAILGRRHLSKNNAAAFTLIELLVVIAVIGALAVGAITFLNPLAQIQKANDAKRKSDLSQIQKALETYYNDYGYFPTSTSNKIQGISWGSAWGQYMILPSDPSASRNYVYCLGVSNQSYYLYASLERGGLLASNRCGAATICGTGVPTCNYGVSSPDTIP